MGFLRRFFGRGEKGEGRAERLAEPQAENRLGLQILFAGGLPMDFDALAAAIQSYHPSMARARCELHDVGEGHLYGVIEWEKHGIRIVGFGAPMPANAVEECVAPAHYDLALKRRARAHASHITLFYAGRDPSPLGQYVALSALAGALARFDAIVVLNPEALTSIGAASLSAAGLEGDRLRGLTDLPLLFLYCGFVKFDVDGIDGVWMRTYGAARFGLPDLAALAAGHQEGELYFFMFETIFGYLRNSGATLSAGHTMQVGDDRYMRCRKPKEEEYFLASEHELFVLEKVGSG